MTKIYLLSRDPNAYEVKIVDQSYLTADFKAKSKSAQQLIDKTFQGFKLNNEQERAFRIIANHAVTPQAEQLKMYLGGMGGTGKSQVIKALMQLFKSRNESHRFVALGPTGTAAALLGGSTYHSFLGIRMSGSGVQNESTSVAQAWGRLEGVDYIFLDEVSMLACHEMYKISSQLAKALNIHNIPYGGINMIFSGDFAQLPPVGGATLYSGHVGTEPDSGLKPHLQEAALGKALWHQVTTAVILRENMRQISQTMEDAKFRTALVNMRYGACTAEDIKFLRLRIAGRRPVQPKVSSKDFRNVAIICGLHTQKDMINQLGCARFAEETGQKLTHFYSIDKWGKEADHATKKNWGKSKAAPKLKHLSNEIDPDDQREIWKLRPGATGHFAGKLSLCLGMPVMIRNNDATELCITKGQEGFVVGWQSSKGPHGKKVLDTLFVKLDNPPQLVQIPGLPDNVVPLVKGRKTVECVFPSDLKESVERQQVWVVQNFAMTAHAAQGKTRPQNVVHLNSCSSHMAYYTALSWSATAEGTIIIQGFDSKVITRGCSGYLRQEFRELELLDDITRLRYEGQLPSQVTGIVRKDLIQQFRQWTGFHYVPAKTDMSLRWSANDSLDAETFQTIGKLKHGLQHLKSSSKFVPALGSKPVLRSPPSSPPAERPLKRLHTAAVSEDEEMDEATAPIGLEWDGEDWSCAYDAFFTILYDIWIQDPKAWSRRFRAIDNKYLTTLDTGFQQVFAEELSFEDLRDSIRPMLHALNPDDFPWGQFGASVGTLAYELLKPQSSVTLNQHMCTNCDYEEPEIDDRLGYALTTTGPQPASTAKWIGGLGHHSHDFCPECQARMTWKIFYKGFPSILTLEYPDTDIKTSHKMFFAADDQKVTLYLRGVIYLGGFHFTSRIIHSDGTVWYHDGQKGHACKKQGHLRSMEDKDLRKCKGRKLMLAVYAQE